MYLIKCQDCGKTAAHESSGVADSLARAHINWLNLIGCETVNVYAPGEWEDEQDLAELRARVDRLEQQLKVMTELARDSARQVRSLQDSRYFDGGGR